MGRFLVEKEQLIGLVSAAQNGDSLAQSELFSAFYNDVYYFALKTVKDENLACDITQETFIEVINTLGNLKEPAAFVTWMKQITYHQCTRYFKKKKDVIISEDEEGHSIFDELSEDSSEFIPDEALDQKDFKRTILALLDELSEEQRSAVLMYYFEELSVSQIAEIQGVSEGTVKSRLNYARKTLKGAVEDYEKKNGIRLHSFGIFGLIRWVLASSGKAVLPISKAATIAQEVSAATGVTVSAGIAAGAAATAAGAAVGVAGAATAGAVATGISAKVVAGIIAGALVVGGAGTAAVVYVNQKNDAPPITSSIVDTGADVSSDINSDFVSSDNSSDISSETTVSVEDATSSEEANTRYVVPAGATYITVTGAKYAAGERVPAAAQVGDTLITEDYTYFCGYYNSADVKGNPNSAENMKLSEMSSHTWSVRVNDTTKTSYADVLGSINEENVTVLARTFMLCEKLTSAPRLPDSATSMLETFQGCLALTYIKNFPKRVENLEYTFEKCGKLTTVPKIPDGVSCMYRTFSNCTSLKSIPNLPASLENLRFAFEYCTSLTSIPEMPDSVENLEGAFAFCWSLETVANLSKNANIMEETFYQCEKLKSVPALPDGVKSLWRTFKACSSLTSVPKLPSNLIAMQETFADCSSLTSVPRIPDSVESMSGTFYGCTSLQRIRNLPSKVNSLATAFCNCSSLTTIPAIPESVCDLTRTFSGCTSLTGTVTIYAKYDSLVSFEEIFAGTKKHIAVRAEARLADRIKATSTVGNISALYLEQ